MSKTELLLSALRDIQEPAAPESVSLWLITANIALFIIFGLLLLLRRNRKREGWRREARWEIQRSQNSDAPYGLMQLAKLLRKIAIQRNGRHSDVHGVIWLKELDAIFSTTWFTTDEGRIFGTALYQKPSISQADFDAISKKVLHYVNALPALAKPIASQS